MTRKLTRTTTPLLALAGLLAIAGVAAAQPPGHHHGHHGFGPPGAPGQWGDAHRFWRHELLAERLDLSETQREQIDAIHEARRTAAEELHRRLWEQRRALHETSLADSFDEAAVRAAAAAMAETEVELAVHRAAVMSEVRALLTPEQRDQLREMRQRFGERRERVRRRWQE